MRVLVIGGAGYIGSHVVADLLRAGHQVRIFDNMSTGRPENIFPDAEFVHGDILDVSALTTALTGVDAVIHLAAKKAVGESMADPAKYAINNITGTLNILNAMAEVGVRYFVFHRPRRCMECRMYRLLMKHVRRIRLIFTVLQSWKSNGF